MKKKMFLLVFLFTFAQAVVSAYEYTPFGFYIPIGWDLPQNFKITEYNNLGTLQSVLVRRGNTLTKQDGVGRPQGYLNQKGNIINQYDCAGNLTGYTTIKDNKIILYDNVGRLQGWWVLSD